MVLPKQGKFFFLFRQSRCHNPFLLFFFFFFHIFGNAIAVIQIGKKIFPNSFLFFFPHFRQWNCRNLFSYFGNPIAIILLSLFFLTFSAIPLSQLLKKNLFPYFGNGISNFFLPISAMQLPQVVYHFYFSPYFGNGIATKFFFLFRQCHCHN